MSCSRVIRDRSSLSLGASSKVASFALLLLDEPLFALLTLFCLRGLSIAFAEDGESFALFPVPLRGRPFAAWACSELRLAMLAARLNAPVFVAEAGLLGAAVPLLEISLGPVTLEREPVRACAPDEGVQGDALMASISSSTNTGECACRL